MNELLNIGRVDRWLSAFYHLNVSQTFTLKEKTTVKFRLTTEQSSL